MMEPPFLLFDPSINRLFAMARQLFGPLDEIDLQDAGELKLDIGSFTSLLQQRGLASPSWIGNRIFLATVVDLIPEVMDELVARHLSMINRYQDWFFAPPAPGREWTPELLLSEVRNAVERLRRGHESDAPPTLERDIVQMMFDWMAKWRLGDDEHTSLADIAYGEALTRAINHLFGTINEGQAEFFSRMDLTLMLARLTVIDAILPGAFVEAAESEVVAIPRWIPTLETWESYEHRAREGFQRYLLMNRRVWSRAAEDEGLVPAATKRHGTWHFKWLARYQVLGESYAAIAASACVAYKTVSEGIKRTAEAIDLPLRPPGRPGRKPKAP